MADPYYQNPYFILLTDMNKQSIREIFDDISLSLITFLDNHVGITDIEFIERQGSSLL